MNINEIENPCTNFYLPAPSSRRLPRFTMRELVKKIKFLRMGSSFDRLFTISRS